MVFKIFEGTLRYFNVLKDISTYFKIFHILQDIWQTANSKEFEYIGSYFLYDYLENIAEV